MQQNTIQTQTQTMTATTTQTDRASSPIQRLETNPSPPHKQSVATMTDPEWSPLRNSPNLLDVENEPLATPIMQETPKEKRPRRTFLSNVCVVQEDNISCPAEETALSPVFQPRRRTYRPIPLDSTPEPQQAQAQVHTAPTPSPIQQEELEDEDLMQFFNLPLNRLPEHP